MGLVLNPNLFDRGLDSLLGYPVIPSIYTHADMLSPVKLASEPNVPEYVGKNTRIEIYSVYAVILINWLMVDWVIAFTQID